MIRVPMTIGHAQRALDRIIAHVPPCGRNNEQFRDAAIWEVVVELASGYDVHFITSDAAFFSERDPRSGATLAPNLREDCERANGRICCYRNVQDCLAALEREAEPLVEGELADILAPAVATMVRDDVTGAELAIGKLAAYSVKAFPTGKPIFALSFGLTFGLESQRAKDEDRLEPQLVVTGECTLDPKAKAVSEVRVASEEIKWTDADGKHHKARPQMLSDLINLMMSKWVNVTDANWTEAVRSFDRTLKIGPSSTRWIEG
jgi:hypothetical protein